MGTLITYGSYINKKDNLTNTAIAVSSADTFIAIIAGVAIIPAVFAFGIEPNAGPGLVFITLPNIFEQMPGGYYWGLLFFILLAVAALTSTVSVLEVVVAYFSEELNLSRKLATVIATVSISVIGVLCTLSQNPVSGLNIFGKNLFDNINHLTANILLPFGGLLIVTFVGWFMGREKVRAELSNEGKLTLAIFDVFMFILRYLAPIAIILLLLFYQEA